MSLKTDRPIDGDRDVIDPLPKGLLSSDGRMNDGMAAPTKNSAPIITLSRTLTGRAWNSKPPIAPGQSQHMAPATAKAMLVSSSPWLHSWPSLRRASQPRFVSRPMASSVARASKMRAVCLAWLEFGRHCEKNLRRPTEIPFGPLVLDWPGDSLRLVN
jgi:hypothetical protein